MLGVCFAVGENIGSIPLAIVPLVVTGAVVVDVANGGRD